MNSRCPCHSGKSYKDCCQPFHEGKLAPPTALALMRSRYSAYAKHLPDYIVRTTHPENPKYMRSHKEILEFCRNTEFAGLKILDFTEEGKTAYVTFHAGLKQKGRDVSFTERSLFNKVDGCWLYRDGTLSH